MIDKDLKKLGRRELVDIIYQLKKNEQQMQGKIAELEKELQDKRIRLSKAGSIADAAVGITDIFSSAQLTADLYLNEINCKREETEKECEKMIADAKEKVERILYEGRLQCSNLSERYREDYDRWIRLKSDIQKTEEEKITDKWMKMSKQKDKRISVPTLKEIQSERKRIRRNAYYRQSLRGTVSVLIVVAAVAVLIATLFLPILQISGDSMAPTLEHDDIVVLFKTKRFDRGDLIGFYYQGKILLKRVIALPEDEVAIDGEGNVYVNGELLEEPYVTNKELGDCDLEFPYKVPGTGYFVMGDSRQNSVDSRNSVVGAISQEDIIGKVFIRVWPFSRFGLGF